MRWLRRDRDSDLRQRARAFLERPIPDELAPHYAPGSLTQMVLVYYAERGSLDDELREAAGLCVIEAADAADRHSTPEAKQFFLDCKELLEAIIEAA